MKTGKGPIALSDEARDRVSEQLHARYVATIVGRLREVGTLDLAAADLPIRVVDRPIVRLAGREGSMTVRSDGFRTAPYLALRDCCALSQLVEYAMRIRSGAVDPRSLPLFQLESCLSDRFEQDWNRVADAVRRRC